MSFEHRRLPYNASPSNIYAPPSEQHSYYLSLIDLMQMHAVLPRYILFTDDSFHNVNVRIPGKQIIMGFDTPLLLESLDILW